MKLNLLLQTFCLLGTVILCGAQNNITVDTVGPTNASATTTSTMTPSAMTTSNTSTTTTVGPTTTTTSNTSTTTTAGSATTASMTTATEGIAPSPAPEKDDGGLSSGAIAGITIGSIAGVAAVGGGIFGALKYTKRI